MTDGFVLITAALALITAALAIWSLQRIRALQGRLNRLLGGLDSTDTLEATIGRYATHVHQVEESTRQLRSHYQQLAKIAAASLQKTAIVRFNPFKNTGGDQSFALALLDNHDCGMLLTSIHSREGTRVYIKPVTYGNSDHALSREERQALQAARGGKSPANSKSK